MAKSLAERQKAFRERLAAKGKKRFICYLDKRLSAFVEGLAKQAGEGTSVQDVLERLITLTFELNQKQTLQVKPPEKIPVSIQVDLSFTERPIEKTRPPELKTTENSPVETLLVTLKNKLHEGAKFVEIEKPLVDILRQKMEQEKISYEGLTKILLSVDFPTSSGRGKWNRGTLRKFIKRYE